MMAIAFLAGMVVVIAVTLTVMRRPLWRWPQRWRRRVGKTLAAIRRLSRRPRVWLFSQSLSLVIQGGFVLLNAAIGSGLGIEVPLAVWFIVWPLAKIAGLLPISLGGLAVREATLAALLVPFGVLATNGVATSLLWQTILIAGGLIAGLAWLVLRRHQFNNEGHDDNHDQGHGDHA
jgi:uncharacterized membrane protein YbhN (UPF0104 family)